MKTRIYVISLLVLGSWALGSLTASGRADPPQSDALLRTLMHAIADLRRQIENIPAGPGPPGPAGPLGPAGPQGPPGPAPRETDDLVANRLALGRDQFSYGRGVTPKLIVHDESRELATIAFFKYSDSFANHMVQGRARGNIAAPADVMDNDVVAQYSGQGYRSGTFEKVAAVNMQVDSSGDLAKGMTGKLVFKVAGLDGSTHSFGTAVEMDRRLRTLFEGAVALRYTSHPLIESDRDDFELGEQRTSVHRFATDAPHAITGFVATKDIDSPVAGELMTLINVGGADLILANQSEQSLEANRVITGTGANLTLGPDQTANLFYDQTSARWRVLSTTGT